MGGASVGGYKTPDGKEFHVFLPLSGPFHFHLSTHLMR
jgi:hypothetical protein